MLKNKRPLYRFRNETFLRPRYFSDFHFMSELDPQEGLPYLPEKFEESEIDIFTTLQFSPEDLVELKEKANPSHHFFHIPILGLPKQSDYFYLETEFKSSTESLKTLIINFPEAHLLLDFQLNCLTVTELSRFLVEVIELKKMIKIELSFGRKNHPPYLNLNLLGQVAQDCLSECLNLMSEDSSFSEKEIDSLRMIIRDTSLEIPSEQLLATFYYAVIMKRPQQSAIKLFPKALRMIKKSAEAFLKMDLKIFEITRPQIDQERLQTKINSLLDQGISIEFLTHFLSIKDYVKCAHNDLEMLEIMKSIIEIPKSTEGVIIEAGVFKGGSTIRLSLICALMGRKLQAYDSFQGLPEHNESSPHMLYPAGAYYGNKAEVIQKLSAYGKPESVELIEGWFHETMPMLTEKVVMAFIDVDLASSTKDCLLGIWPKLIEGGVIFSHDAHFEQVDHLLNSVEFWQTNFNELPPKIEKVLGSKNLVKIKKQAHLRE
jgi:O-methyltransferase